MTNESRAFFQTVTPADPAKRASATTDAFYAAALPLHELAATVQSRIAAIRLAHARANSAEEDVGVYGKFERFIQACGAMERDLAQLTAAAQNLADSSFQLDLYGAAVWGELGEERPAADGI